nr:SurA N-terminal domain-containing protein [uncultured Shimia sp.]
MSKGSTSKTLVWILMAMLIFGLGGFGITNLSGTVRTVGSVGDKEIDITAYARALQQEQRAQQAQVGRPISFPEMQANGLDRAVLGQMVTSRAMDAETTRMGISIGDENLRKELLQIQAFQSPDGSFDRAAYRFAMQQAGLSEADFEDTIREDTVRTLLQASVISGVTLPSAFADTVLNYLGETRNFTWTRLQDANLAYPVATPTEADLKGYYDANIAEFSLPAARQLTYVWLSPDMLIDTLEIDEESLKALYEDRDLQYNRPEHRLVERLAFSDTATAEAAKARLDSGDVTFEILVLERGLALADVDLGDVSQAELGQAGDTVFSAQSGMIVGPLDTDLGPALFRVNGILPEQITSYEDAKGVLREELAADRARRVIDTQIGDIDDLLAAGATLEEIAAETDMELGTVDWHAGSTAAIAGYETFQTVAAVVADSDFPQVETLDDGGIFAVRLEAEIASRPAPFEDVRADVADKWTAAQTVTRLQEMADTLVPQLSGDVDFTVFGLVANEETDMVRTGFVPEAPQGFMAQIFEMAQGDVDVIADDTSVWVVKLDAIGTPDLESEEAKGLHAAISQQNSSGLAQDIFDAYAREIQKLYPVTLNQQALNAVHAQMQ